MASPEIIYISSDNIIEVTGVLNVPAGTYINNASVTVTLVDATTGVEVTGQTWPLALSYVSGSNGDYRGTLTDSMVLSNSQELIAKVTVDGGAGLKRYWERDALAIVGH